MSNGGVSTYFTPYSHTITTPGSYNLTWHFSNGQTVSKSITVSEAACVDTYSSTSTGQYVKSVVKYSKGTIEQDGILYVNYSGPPVS